MAGRKRKYPIGLTAAERNRIKETLRSTKSSNTIKQRCRILLALDCNQNPNTTYDDCAYYLGVYVGMIYRTKYRIIHQCYVYRLSCVAPAIKAYILPKQWTHGQSLHHKT